MQNLINHPTGRRSTWEVTTTQTVWCGRWSALRMNRASDITGTRIPSGQSTTRPRWNSPDELRLRRYTSTRIKMTETRAERLRMTKVHLISSLSFFLHSLVLKNEKEATKVGSVVVNIDWFLNVVWFHFELDCPEIYFNPWGNPCIAL